MDGSEDVPKGDPEIHPSLQLFHKASSGSFTLIWGSLFLPIYTFTSSQSVMWKTGLFCYTVLTPDSFHTHFPALQVEMLCPVCGHPSRAGAQTTCLLLCSVPCRSTDQTHRAEGARGRAKTDHPQQKNTTFCSHSENPAFRSLDVGDHLPTRVQTHPGLSFSETNKE